MRYFAWHDVKTSSPPDWFRNPWTGGVYPGASVHWTEIADFLAGLGDIKVVWEPSRFDWAPKMAWRARKGDGEALRRCEAWLRDWAAKNPANGGVNWKCGQEAGLRCLNLLLAAALVNERFDSPFDGFRNLLEIHLDRIWVTRGYAVAQENNHAISEAAALFVTGRYLAECGSKGRRGWHRAMEKAGRRLLEKGVARLILPDGSFSQQSVNYHRLTLDILSLVELLRRRLGAEPFSTVFYERVKAAIRWLHFMVDEETGGAPNIGGNDGAHLFNLNEAPYRDFRPSVKLAYAVFWGLGEGDNQASHPLADVFAKETPADGTVQSPATQAMLQGGYICLRRPRGFAILRLPNDRFRPSAEALHLDIWHAGVNWVRGAGSYSYAADRSDKGDIAGTKGCSTVVFDGRDQMPVVSRFLYGGRLKPDIVEWVESERRACSRYTDYLGASHQREIRMESWGWRVTDWVSGHFELAVIRWRLAPVPWMLEGTSVRAEGLSLAVQADADISCMLSEGWESLYYLAKSRVPIFEVHCRKPARIISDITVD